MKWSSIIAASLILLTGCSRQKENESIEQVTTFVITTEASQTTTFANTTTIIQTETSTKETTTEPETDVEQTETESDISKGLLTTEIEYPFSMLREWSEFAGQEFDIEQWRLDFESNEKIKGVQSTEINGDTLIVKFNTKEYKAMREEVLNSIVEYGNQIIGDSGNSITDIQYDDSFSEVRFFVESEELYRNTERNAVIQFMFNITSANQFYRFFSDEYTFRVIDSQTGTDIYTETK